MFAVLDAGLWPQAFINTARQANITLDDRYSLILIGHGGNAMWQKLNPQRSRGPDPVDEFSVRSAKHFVRRYVGACGYEILYPGPVPIPLQQLGAIAGWHHPSPLGLGVNPLYGPWFGYRVVLLVPVKLPTQIDSGGRSPCDECASKPCLFACPAKALSAARAPDVKACVDYRLQDGSPCQSQCHARLACPVGEEFRYQPAQLNYYYGRSLQSIRAYMDEDDA